MSKKSSMNANIVAIASKIKMKPNATKILFISDAIHGLAQRCLDMRRRSIFLQRGLTKLTPVDIVEKISHDQAFLHHLPPVIKSQSPRNRIGKRE
jgi:hypothetical protein